MPSSFLTRYKADLDNLSGTNRRRRLMLRAGMDFSSNDYLALANSDRLKSAADAALSRGVGVGACGSRLLRGNDEEHEALEAEASAQFGCESSLYFGSGFAANCAVFATIPQRGDRVFFDSLIHASAHDGMRLGRAETKSVRHNDAQAFDDAIRHWRKDGGMGRPFIAVETLYSMDGDIAPLRELKSIVDAHDGALIIDEAHATGVFGERGNGLGEAIVGAENVIVLHTCGKALGASGGIVSLPTVLRDFMVNRARPFIFSTGPSPLIAAVVRESLKILSDEPWRREKLKTLFEHAGREVSAKLGGKPSGTQIIPIIVGEDGPTMQLAERLQKLGFDIRGIRPPTVPAGTARLRLTITLHTNEQAISQLVDEIADAMAVTDA